MNDTVNTNGDKVEKTSYDPASMAISSLSMTRVVWYKRPWVMITAVITVIVAISVITDLPKPLTVAQDIAAQNSAMKQINIDIKPCTFGLQESFGFYRRESSSRLSPSQMKVITTYLVSDQTVCSFAAPSMSELTNNLQLLDTPAGKQLERMRTTIVTWMDSDANGAIADIWLFSTHHATSNTLADLKKREFFLAQDRQTALADAANANAILGTTLTAPNLPALTSLPGT